MTISKSSPRELMSRFRTPTSRGQLHLFPPSLEELISKNDSVRYLDELVEMFDLSEIELSYSHDGRPGYHPSILVKILLYGKIRGIRSCRKLATACEENIRFIFLAQGEKPDFRTLSSFRKKYSEQLGGLLKQSVRIGLEQGVIKLEEIAIDGTVIRASANPFTFYNPKELEEAIAKLESEIEASFLEDARSDYGLKEPGLALDTPLPEELQNKVRRKEKLESALKYSNELEGKKPGTVSTTDHESRMMKRRKRTTPAYNCQAAVDMESGCIVGGYASNDGLDWHQLSPMLESIEETTDQYPKKLAADRGYYTGDSIRTLDEKGIEGFIPMIERGPEGFQQKDFTYDKENDEFKCPEGRLLIPKHANPRKDTGARDFSSLDCSGCKSTDSCLSPSNKERRRILKVMEPKEIFDKHRAKWQSEEGKEMSKKRMTTIEPVFGNIKFGRKLHQLTVRGLEMVDAMWKMELCAHNLLKLAKYKAV